MVPTQISQKARTGRLRKKVILFGDSGSSIHKTPMKILGYPAAYLPFSPPFPPTRFSSNRVFTDFLAENLSEFDFQDSHMLSVPGATTFETNYTNFYVQEEKKFLGTYLLQRMPSLPDQIRNALALTTGQPPEKKNNYICIFWIGHNDLLSAPYLSKIQKNWIKLGDSQLTHDDIRHLDNAILEICEEGPNNIIRQIKHLIIKGGLRNFWIQEVAWLHTAPRFMRLRKNLPPKMQHLIANMSIWYNQNLKDKLKSLEDNLLKGFYPDCQIQYIPTCPILESETPPPPFTAETYKKTWLEEYEKEKGIAFTPHTLSPQDQQHLSRYFYYDDIHMSEAGHAFTAQNFIENIRKIPDHTQIRA